MTLGDRIRQRRHELGLTQANAAELAGHTAGWLAFIEGGQRNITFADLERLADVLGTTVGALTDTEPKITLITGTDRLTTTVADGDTILVAPGQIVRYRHAIDLTPETTT